MRRPLNQWSSRPEMAGYWQTWNLPDGETMPLLCVPCEFTDVIIAFVAPDEEGVLRFTGSNVPTRQDICCLRQRGQRVLLSVGGGGVQVTLETNEQVARFSDSLYELARSLCVNGIDIDVEQGMLATGSPDQPQGTTLGLIRGLDRVLAAFPADFALTMAPETVNLVGGITRFGDVWGNYLPLLLHFGSRLTRVHMQYYNSGPMTGLDGRTYEPGTVDFAVAMTEAIVKGFPIADTGVTFCGLPPWKVSIGLPATAAAASNGYLTPQQVKETLERLRTGYRGEDQPRGMAIPCLGGLMTWSVQWDAQNGFEFVLSGARALRGDYCSNHQRH